MPAVPAAIISTLLVADSGGFDEASGQINCRLEQAGLDGTRLVLAGIGGAGETALQLALGRDAMACSGVLACGDILPPLELLAGRAGGFGTRLRLVWTEDEPLFCAAALGDLLRCFRAAGVDAQGAVLARQDGRSREARSSSDPSPALVRLGRAYLAELVAVALGAASRPHARLTTTE